METQFCVSPGSAGHEHPNRLAPFVIALTALALASACLRATLAVSRTGHPTRNVHPVRFAPNIGDAADPDGVPDTVYLAEPDPRLNLVRTVHLKRQYANWLAAVQRVRQASDPVSRQKAACSCAQCVRLYNIVAAEQTPEALASTHLPRHLASP